MKKKYKIVVAYDGTNYFGWQKQDNLATVAGTLERSFSETFGRTISLTAASRTDAGVHALTQIAQFSTDLAIKSEKLSYAWGNALPADIVIRSLDVVDDSFHIHGAVVSKTYRYYFFLEKPLPFVQRYGWYFYYPVSLKKLEKALSVFVGTHDFRSFCTGYDREDTVRTIDAVSVFFDDTRSAYCIEITGKKFLHHMVRRIVGACLEVSSRPFLSIDYLKSALEEKNPEQSLPNAPAKGLLLYHIAYTE